jgi:hypothetical protein
MADKVLTVKQVAERYDVAPSTARAWCLSGMLKGAYLAESPAGTYYAIPESSLAGFEPPRRGPKPKAKGGARKRATSQKRSNGGASTGKKKGGKK